MLPGDPGDEHNDEDEQIDDLAEFRPPLPPEDRIWRHPSEVAAFGAPTGTNRSKTENPAAGRRRIDSIPHRGVVAMAAVAALIGATGSVGILAATGRLDPATVIIERDVAIAPVGDDEPTVQAISSRISPSVASVSVTRGTEVTQSKAFAFRSDGYLLAPAHMVADADALVVRIAGASSPATLVATDAVTDVAVLHIPRTDLDPADVGTAARIKTGDRAYLVGTDIDDPMVTSTELASVGGRATLPSGASLHDMMMLDEAVDARTIGCAVVDEYGAVIGMMSMASYATDDRPAAAVITPIDLAIDIGNQLIATGHATHAWLGVSGSDLGTEADAGGGATVAEVIKDGPADLAGVQPGDVITSINGQPVDSMTDLVTELRAHDPGEEVTIGMHRDGESSEATAVIGTRP